MAFAATSVVGDFDRDGVKDIARAVHSRGEIAIVIDSGRPRHRHLVYRQKLSDPFVAINHYRGRMKTACGKGYEVDCPPGSPKTILLRGGELIFGQKESTSFVAVLRGGRFISVQLSD
jgi:hypothetical protein